MQEESKETTYVEVIGDTVYGKHLMTTIIISISLSLIGFYIGKRIFPGIAPEQMVQSYSLLLGIVGSLLGLMINTFLFKPKRTLNETPSTSDEINEVYKTLQFDLEADRQAILADPVTTKEMKEQGYYDMFMKEEREKE